MDAIANFGEIAVPPELFQPQPPPKYPWSRKLCTIEPCRHGIRSPKKGALGIVDVNVLYHALRQSARKNFFLAGWYNITSFMSGYPSPPHYLCNGDVTTAIRAVVGMKG
jgi:hypothetical protein